MKKIITKATVSILLLLSILAIGLYVYMSFDQTEGTISSDIELVTSTSVVYLQNGDTYDLSAGYVTKEINGKAYKMLAYNGMIPGPLIKVPKNAEVTINFTNNFDMETALHSHGVRLENQYDGVPHLTQEPIKPGDSFIYKVKFPDVGMYWYHPHVREDYQQELGLYGNYLVVPENEHEWNKVNQEIPLFLDDILIENQNISLNKKIADHTLMGRYGNILLVNGETDYQLQVKKGEVIRLYVTNSANARPFNFYIENASMKLVGGDSGLYEFESIQDSIILGPSERAIIEVLFTTSGMHNMYTKTLDEKYTLGKITVSDVNIEESYADDFFALKENKELIEERINFDEYFNKTPDKNLTLTLAMHGSMMNNMMNQGMHGMHGGQNMPGNMMMPSEDGIEWNDDNQQMNRVSDTSNVTWKIVDSDTGKQNMDIDWNFKVGDAVKIRIFNDPNSMHPMQHPIHFHGQRFLILTQNGVKNDNLVWKDTVMIPAGHTVDILLELSNPGDWMAHCHIAEHLEADMMFAYKVEK